MLGKKERAEALGSDPFTRFSELEFLGQILRPRKQSCPGEVGGWLQKQHLPPWMTDPPPPLPTVPLKCAVWSWSGVAVEPDIRILKWGEEMMERRGEKDNAWRLFTRVLLHGKTISQRRKDTHKRCSNDVLFVWVCVFRSMLISLCPLFVGGSWKCGDDWFKWISRTKGESEPTNRQQNIPGKVHELHLSAVLVVPLDWSGLISFKIGAEWWCGIQGLTGS